ncbi:uncharacterized protein MELLADRAFT_79083 [Melampsora larici-populina 98AG31]|uniref:Uncharacterized protein n=1 Tax=Melampsora larici-populina (strain 98AG31 / pathotype 3-4-7) TaxID=747676 RepID=F4S2I1_MELLP|nr:uncharacterized protein MELLADRAFT_79083 [Melampsora larici-populina 98AG31]EGG01182.1 hypothetical protein MELLADRAFT_79083 [Melampsora larici-populina 98AG31]
MNTHPTLTFHPSSSLHSHSIHHHHHQVEIDEGQENGMNSNVHLSSNPMAYHNFDEMISQVIETNLNQHFQSVDHLKVNAKPLVERDPNWLIEPEFKLKTSQELPNESLTPNSMTTTPTTTNSTSKQSINLLTIIDQPTILSKPQVHQIPKFIRASSDSAHLKAIKPDQSVCSDREINFNSISTPLHPQNDPRSQLTQWREEAIEYVRKREEILAWINGLPGSFGLDEIHQAIDWEVVKDEDVVEGIVKDGLDDQLVHLLASDLDGLKIEKLEPIHQTSL